MSVRKEVDEAVSAGDRDLAAVRREVWPDLGGDVPEDGCSPDDLMRYIEALESQVRGQGAALRFIGRSLKL